MGNLFGSIVANGIGAVDAVTPGRFGQTLNSNIRDQNSDIYGATRDGKIMTAQEIAAQKAADDAARNQQGNVNGAFTGDGAYAGQAGGAGGTSAADQAYIATQLADLNSLLGRTDTKLAQGLQGLDESYQDSVTRQDNQKRQALQDYSDKRVETNKDKLGAYNTINKNASNGYRSLSQIIGRGAGTGSSAFQEALPDAIGKGISSQRTDANQTYASNLGQIDTAQKKTENSFADILRDLANQRAIQERDLKTGVEQQKQSIYGQQQQLEASRGNSAAARGLQPAIENSRNSVEGFFNQFKPTITAQQAAIAAPDLSGYEVDRANVNAQAQGAQDPGNPYADILRKRLQEQNL